MPPGIGPGLPGPLNDRLFPLYAHHGGLAWAALKGALVGALFFFGSLAVIGLGIWGVRRMQRRRIENLKDHEPGGFIN